MVNKNRLKSVFKPASDWVDFTLSSTVFVWITSAFWSGCGYANVDNSKKQADTDGFLWITLWIVWKSLHGARDDLRAASKATNRFSAR